ncbi:hypothetical protein RF11_16027 [Thelohanellus kitauei]|uniref:Uncharacterized protein n=1 Tax=Thelohanellus kitauei TaxID=669202 RepID=A0A0C2MQF6_THEKT|nr:hypothetical protein RF11_16027 [Thelohanellus kitauei]
MLQRKLQRHFDMHRIYLNKDTNYFRLRTDEVGKTRFDVCGISNTQIIAAFEPYYCWGSESEAMKPHAVADELLLPEGIDIVRIVIGEKKFHKLNGIFTFNDTSLRIIAERSADILDQIIQKM